MYDEGIAEHKEMADNLRAYQRALEQGFAKKHQLEEAVMKEDPERHDREESKRLEELRALGYVE
jgi:hypothetical protein